MKWLAMLRTIWEALPKVLQRVIALATAVLVVLGGLLLLGLVWSTGIIQTRLSGMLTKDDLIEQTQSLQRFSAEQIAQIDSIAYAAALANDIELRAYIADERQLAMDTAYIPLLRIVKQVLTTQNMMRGTQHMTDERVKALPIQFDEKLDRVLEAAAPQRTEEMLQRIIDENAAMREEIDAIRLEQKTGRRTTKNKF